MPRITSLNVGGRTPISGLRIAEIPPTVRLVVLIGPNGTGKTSLLNALALNPDGPKFPQGQPVVDAFGTDSMPLSHSQVYSRSAYRTEHSVDVCAGDLIIPHAPVKPVHGGPGSRDQKVSHNFKKLLHLAHRLAMSSSKSWDESVAHLLEPLGNRMSALFPSLQLSQITYPTGPNNGQSLETLCFEKNGDKYQYAGLSAGEKEVLDLLLDLQITAEEYPDAIYCIDEPELHLHSELESRLLPQLLDFLPGESQMWIATHSIGIIRAAFDLYRSRPDEVAFIDFGDLQKGATEIRPATVDRAFWKKVLSVALHDLSELVIAGEIVICEGRPLGTIGKQTKCEFDAKIYRKIFAKSRPDTDFVSAGSCSEVDNDAMKLGASLEALSSGVRVVRLIDQDNRSPVEVEELRQRGRRVLSRYSIESYLWCDEILDKLFSQHNIDTKDAERIRALKREANQPEDHLQPLKDEVHEVRKELVKLKALRTGGNTAEAFATHMLAPLITEDTDTFRELQTDIFGEGSA